MGIGELLWQTDKCRGRGGSGLEKGVICDDLSFRPGQKQHSQFVHTAETMIMSGRFTLHYQYVRN